MPTALMADRLSLGNTPSSNPVLQRKDGNLLKTLLSEEPYFKMDKTTVEQLLKITRKLAHGEHYIPILKKLPPVPEGCPIVMRGLETNETILIYYIKKKFDNTTIHPNDQHITLIFDTNGNLKGKEEVI